VFDQTITRRNPNGAMAGDRADNFERFVDGIYQELIGEQVFLALDDRQISKETKYKIIADFRQAAEEKAAHERDQYGL